MLACGLATHFVPSTKLGFLEESLVRVDTTDSFTICGIIDQFSQHMPLRENSAYNWLNIIDRCFSRSSVEEILSALELEAAHETAKWISVAIESLKKASPTSLKLSLRLIREGRKQQVGPCLIKDYRVCSHIVRKELSNDFFEGGRAILVDKDRNPKWNPRKLEVIDDNMVENYFSKVDDALWEDLKLPLRHNSKFQPPSKL